MKSFTQFFVLNCAFVIILVASCRKTETSVSTTTTTTKTNPGTPPPVIPPSGPSTDKTKLNQLFAGLRTAPQSFTTTAGAYNTLIGANGTVLNFYPNSFKDASGNVIASGTINIALIEMYKPGQMIANRASTIDNGNLLASGGQVYISATKNGQEVYANKYGVAFAQPASSGQNMVLYYGSTANTDSVTTWTIADTTKIGTIARGTTHDTAMISYKFDSCTHFHLINCDHFYGSPSPLTSVSLVVPDTSFNQSNTQVYVIFPTINSVTYMSQYAATTHNFYLSSNFDVPVGMTIDVVVMTYKNGNYYYYEQTGITVISNISITATMSPATLPYIISQLTTL